MTGTAWRWSEWRRRCLWEARRYGAGADAEDAVQEAFLRAWRNRTHCRQPDSPLQWVLQITRNEALRLRGRTEADPGELGDLTEAADAPAWADATLVRVDVQRAIRRLDPQDSALLELRYGLDLTQEAVAAALGIPRERLKSACTVCESGSRPVYLTMPKTTEQSKKRSTRPSEELDARTVKALAHPLRHRILSRLNEKVASPKELADEFGEPLNRLSYHVRALENLGCIELVSTTPRRGALEHHYRALMRPFFSEHDWISLPASARRSIVDQHLRRIGTDVERAAKAHGFDHDSVHVSWTPMDLDERGMRELDRLLGATLEKALRIHAQSVDRQIKRGTGSPPPLETELVMLHFLRAPTPPKRRRRPKRS